jgi:NitT/TauT family transport system permease protein
MFKRVILGLVGFALFLLVWEAVLRLGILSARVVAFPSTFIAFLAGNPPLDGFLAAMLSSAWQLAAGVGIGALAGIVLGLALGWSRRVGAALEPTVIAINAVPLIAVIPLMIVLLGIGAATALTIVALFAFFPVYFAVSSAVAGVDAKLVRMCRAFGGTEWHVLTGIVLPTTVPAITAGLRLSIGRALTGLVVVELFIGQGGLGSIILNAVNQSMPNLALLAVVVLGVVNMVASGALLLLQNRVDTWRPDQSAG